MGLFEDIWDWMKSLVQGLINAALYNFKYWVNNAIKAAIGAIDWAITNITNVVNNVYNTVKKYTTNVYNTTKQYITNSYTYVTESITNNISHVNENVTNVIGASKEWVGEQLRDERAWTRSFFKLMDPTGFLTDPIGTIKAVFTLQREIAGHAVVKSFWEGFEEGLEE